MRVNQQQSDTAIAHAATWLVVGLLAALGIAEVSLNDWHNRLPRVAYIVACLVSTGLWLWYHRLVTVRRFSRTRTVLMVVLAGLAVFLAGGWMWLMPALGLSAIMLWHGRWRWPALALLLGLTAGVTSLDNPLPTTIIMATVSLIMAGVLVAFTRMVLVVRELMATREQVARLRVDEERMRIQRDLHDLLGRTLVTVNMRTQTAARLLDRNPQAAREQLEESTALLTSGQAQLRELVAGRSIVGLDQELQSARELCARLGIRLDVQVEPLDDDSADDLAARVVREAMTNMLKHARPTHASITVDDEAGCTVARVTNDGALGLPPSPSHGTGLRDLRSRIDDHLGGTLGVFQRPGGVFVVEARIPRTVAASHQLAATPEPTPSGGRIAR